MKKVLSFSFLLIVGLLLSQFLPDVMGEGYVAVSKTVYILLGTCLAFIMINVHFSPSGQEFFLERMGVGVFILRLKVNGLYGTMKARFLIPDSGAGNAAL